MELVFESVFNATLLLIQFAQLLIAPVINAVFAFGEERGWRGSLLSQLLPWGRWRALILTKGKVNKRQGMVRFSVCSGLVYIV
jgi:hypothetical protein